MIRIEQPDDSEVTFKKPRTEDRFSVDNREMEGPLTFEGARAADVEQSDGHPAANDNGVRGGRTGHGTGHVIKVGNREKRRTALAALEEDDKSQAALQHY